MTTIRVFLATLVCSASILLLDQGIEVKGLCLALLIAELAWSYLVVDKERAIAKSLMNERELRVKAEKEAQVVRGEWEGAKVRLHEETERRKELMLRLKSVEQQHTLEIEALKASLAALKTTAGLVNNDSVSKTDFVAKAGF